MEIGGEIVTARRGGQTLRVKGVWIHSTYDPVLEAKRWVEGLQCDSNDTVIVLGVGLGYHLVALKKRIKEGKIIALEPCTELEEYCSPYWVFKHLQGDGAIFVYDRKEPLFNFLARLIHSFNLEKVKVVEYLPLQRLFPQEFLHLRREINNVLFSLLCSANTILHFSYQWTVNFFANLSKGLNAIPVKILEKAFEGKPGVIVSAGPSLGKNIELLTDLQHKAVILVVGTALKSVLGTGVSPTFAVSIDGGKENYRHFEGIDTAGFPLVCDLIIYSQILKDYKGPVIVGAFFNIFNKWLTHIGCNLPGQIRHGPSVANFAFDFALHLGLNPIIFVGQDLAYTDGYTHVRGAAYCRSVSPTTELELLEVDSIDGGKVLTSRTLHSMLQYLETQIALTASDRTVINATEGGAQIAGTQVMTLREAIDLYCQENFAPEERVKQICCSYTPPDETELSIIADKIRGEGEELREILKICRTGVRLAKNLELAFAAKAPDQRQIDKILKRLDRIDEELKARRDELLPANMVFQPIWFQLNKGAFAKEEDNWQAEGLRIARKSELLYQGLVRGIEIVHKAMLQAANQLAGS